MKIKRPGKLLSNYKVPEHIDEQKYVSWWDEGTQGWIYRHEIPKKLFGGYVFGQLDRIEYRWYPKLTKEQLK